VLAGMQLVGRGRPASHCRRDGRSIASGRQPPGTQAGQQPPVAAARSSSPSAAYRAQGMLQTLLFFLLNRRKPPFKNGARTADREETTRCARADPHGGNAVFGRGPKTPRPQQCGDTAATRAPAGAQEVGRQRQARRGARPQADGSFYQPSPRSPQLVTLMARGPAG
jgi:hypothetical protein